MLTLTLSLCDHVHLHIVILAVVFVFLLLKFYLGDALIVYSTTLDISAHHIMHPKQTKSITVVYYLINSRTKQAFRQLVFIH